jgi:hypothetical protein
MRIRELTNEESEKLAGIFQNVFDSDLPPENHSTYYGAFGDDGELKGFVLAENVCWVGQIYNLDPDNPIYPIALVRHMDKITKDQAVVTVASKEKFGKFFETMGMEKIEGTLYRRG